MIFSFQTYQSEIKILLKQIGGTKRKLSRLKSLLIDCYKYNYIATDPQVLDGRKKADRASLINLAETFISTKLVTRRTIKDRGWTDKLIEQHLQVDIYAKNPYYKISGDMKLYSLPRIERLELVDLNLAKAIALNQAKKDKRAYKNQQRLEAAPFKWLSAIGDPWVAIALLLRLINKAVKNFKDYSRRKHIYAIKDRSLIRLKPFLVQTCIAREEIFTRQKLYCHWFNINSYRLSFNSYQSLGQSPQINLEQYNLRFGSPLLKSDRDLLFKLSGWRTLNEAIAGLEFLLSQEYFGKFCVQQVTGEFSSPQHPVPPTTDYLFALKLEEESVIMYKNFANHKKAIAQYLINGCPLQLDCNQMGKVNQWRCLNYNNCQENANFPPHM